LGDADHHDLVIIGGGIGGVICLKYAKAAGLNAVLLERKNGVGGVWRDLPSWQDIQIRKEDWTLGSLPIAGEDQCSIVDNIEAWVERFDLSPMMRLNTEVSSARPVVGGWEIAAGNNSYHSRYLVAATGGHNLAFIPEVERVGSTIRERHSSTLEDPAELSGRRVLVVGGGASAYDLLDLCLERNAQSVIWVYRSLKWMRPTRKKKYFGTDVRFLAKQQMLGVSMEKLNRLVNQDLRSRYEKAGIAEILPGYDFDFRRHQLIPGRRGMIAGFGRIERQPGEIVRLAGSTAVLSNGRTIETDTILWGTGYTVDLSYFSLEGLAEVTRLDELEARCGSLFLSLDAPNLFFLAPAVLETVTSTPWAYAHAARSIMFHIRSGGVFDDTPIEGHINHYDLAKFLARRDKSSFVPGLWYFQYLASSMLHPKNKPLPIP